MGTYALDHFIVKGHCRATSFTARRCSSYFLCAIKWLELECWRGTWDHTHFSNS